MPGMALLKKFVACLCCHNSAQLLDGKFAELPATQTGSSSLNTQTDRQMHELFMLQTIRRASHTVMHRQTLGCTDRHSDVQIDNHMHIHKVAGAEVQKYGWMPRQALRFQQEDDYSITVLRISSYQRRPYEAAAPEDLPSLKVVQNPGHNTAPVGRNAVQEGQPATGPPEVSCQYIRTTLIVIHQRVPSTPHACSL